jgi:hypothetical protein
MSSRIKRDHRTIAPETILQEVGNAEPLYRWAKKNVTHEFSIGPFQVKGIEKNYTMGPFRIGGVGRLQSYTDESLGARLRHAWALPGRTRTETAHIWRTHLTRLGVLACPQAAWGTRYRIFVIGHTGNPDSQVPELPDDLWPDVMKALRNLGRYGKLADILCGLSRQK